MAAVFIISYCVAFATQVKRLFFERLSSGALEATVAFAAAKAAGESNVTCSDLLN
jgi:hypothetical protein